MTAWSASCVCLSPRSLPGAAGKIRRGSTWPYILCLCCSHRCAYSGLAQSCLCAVCHACAPWRGKNRSAGDGLALCHRLCLPSTPHCLQSHPLSPCGPVHLLGDWVKQSQKGRRVLILETLLTGAAARKWPTQISPGTRSSIPTCLSWKETKRF